MGVFQGIGQYVGLAPLYSEGVLICEQSLELLTYLLAVL